jgi:hypothetical protein
MTKSVHQISIQNHQYRRAAVQWSNLLATGRWVLELAVVATAASPGLVGDTIGTGWTNCQAAMRLVYEQERMEILGNAGGAASPVGA